MKIESFSNQLEYKDNRVSTKVLLDTAFTRELRILLKEGQHMKEHKAPFPIIVHVLEGNINFGVEGKTYPIKKGDIFTLDANIPHDLSALKNSIVRLSLSKLDSFER